MLNQVISSILLFSQSSIIIAQENDLFSIPQILEESNIQSFKKQALKAVFLKDCQHVIPEISEWVFQEWSSYDQTLTKKKVADYFFSRLNSDQAPVTFVLLKDQSPCGIISLKYELDPEFSDFPKEALWMGSLIVPPEYKNKGIEEELLNVVKKGAKNLGQDTLYVYISNPSYVDWYLNNGATLLEKRPFRNHTIAIMQFRL